jgi:hypothetical protein
MKILVTVASRHGATREIAESIATAAGTALTDAGVRSQTETRDASLVTSVDGFDAVILGSAVYMGHWLEVAAKLAETLVDELRGRAGPAMPGCQPFLWWALGSRRSPATTPPSRRPAGSWWSSRGATAAEGGAGRRRRRW